MRGRVMALRIGFALGGNAHRRTDVGATDHWRPRWALGVGAPRASRRR